jgi:polyhydroxyalkanoate synthesis regulator phasin
MPQPPDWNKYLDAGVEFVAMTRTQARKRAKELVGTGQLAQEQVAGFVDDLVDESRKRTDVLLEIVRKEIQRQVKTLGIATKEDLTKLESKLATSKPAKTTKSAARKSAARKSAAKKSAAKKPGSKSAAKKSSTKKTSAKKSTKKAASKAAS